MFRETNTPHRGVVRRTYASTNDRAITSRKRSRKLCISSDMVFSIPTHLPIPTSLNYNSTCPPTHFIPLLTSSHLHTIHPPPPHTSSHCTCTLFSYTSSSTLSTHTTHAFTSSTHPLHTPPPCPLTHPHTPSTPMPTHTPSTPSTPSIPPSYASISHTLYTHPPEPPPFFFHTSPHNGHSHPPYLLTLLLASAHYTCTDLLHTPSIRPPHILTHPPHPPPTTPPHGSTSLCPLTQCRDIHLSHLPHSSSAHPPPRHTQPPPCLHTPLQASTHHVHPPPFCLLHWTSTTDSE